MEPNLEWFIAELDRAVAIMKDFSNNAIRTGSREHSVSDLVMSNIKRAAEAVSSKVKRDIGED